MPSLAYAVPILPGKTEDLRIMAAEVMGPRLDEHSRSMIAKGLQRETVWIQPADRGEMIVIYLEGANPWESIKQLANARDEYDLWYKDQLGPEGITATDFSKPIPPDSVEGIYESHVATDEAHQETVAFAVRVLPGRAADWRRLADELKLDRRQEMEDFHRKVGLTTENWYVEHTTGGDLGVIYFRTPDLPETLTRLTQAREPFDRWLKEQLRSAVSMDYEIPTDMIPELVLDWQSQQREQAVA